ncbi:hypothetical protein [Caulobacter sp. DWP3-1-3b2]|uniref:hypothetical protein n=1 Tax=Caulobacter sp. DWP3-1-3b2 TaxID=2804643 RepID=UPI003CF60ACA
MAGDAAEKLLTVLRGGLWHVTHPRRFEQIMASGGLLAEPSDSNEGRVGTAKGPEGYPFIRSRGGISLFELFEFDADAYTERCPSSTWRTFIPCPPTWGGGVWIEIDQPSIAAFYISGADAWQSYSSAPDRARLIMPFIEAGAMQPVPVSSFRRALFVNSSKGDWVPVPLNRFDAEAFAAKVAAWESDVAARSAETLHSALGIR